MPAVNRYTIEVTTRYQVTALSFASAVEAAEAEARKGADPPRDGGCPHVSAAEIIAVGSARK